MLEPKKNKQKKAIELFETGYLNTLEVGKYDSLAKINKFLFKDIYNFAGKLRTTNIAKGNFRFAPIIYLKESLKNINKMPQSTFNQIIEKYVEINIVHPL